MSAGMSEISVLEPVSPAIERVKVLLFRPVDLGRWFVIGFCAWLAYLGRGGFGLNFPFRCGRGFRSGCGGATEFFHSNLPLVISLISVGIFVFVLILLGVVWLSSRGRFMFVYCVSQNKAEVRQPWGHFRRQAFSLFAFRILVGVASFIGIGILAGVAGLWMYLFSANNGLTVAAGFVAGAAGLFMVLPIVIIFVLVFKFTSDFVVPIMYLGGVGCVEGWRRFLSILVVNKANFLLYILFQIVIGMVTGAIVAAAVLLTCCCAACILVIPYIGTVFLLPILVFVRSYSLYYLAQFGPAFNVFISKVDKA